MKCWIISREIIQKKEVEVKVGVIVSGGGIGGIAAGAGAGIGPVVDGEKIGTMTIDLKTIKKIFLILITIINDIILIKMKDGKKMPKLKWKKKPKEKNLPAMEDMDLSGKGHMNKYIFIKL